MSGFDCLNLDKVTGFEWDSGNLFKSKTKHDVSRQEVEEVFFNRPLMLASDLKHSQREPPHCYCLGQTDAGRRLFVVFTVRDTKIRVISARPMHRKERAIYDQTS